MRLQLAEMAAPSRPLRRCFRWVEFRRTDHKFMLNVKAYATAGILFGILGTTALLTLHGHFAVGTTGTSLSYGNDMSLIAQPQPRSDQRTCRELVENDRKLVKCCKSWGMFGGNDCVYN